MLGPPREKVEGEGTLDQQIKCNPLYPPCQGDKCSNPLLCESSMPEGCLVRPAKRSRVRAPWTNKSNATPYIPLVRGTNAVTPCIPLIRGTHTVAFFISLAADLRYPADAAWGRDIRPPRPKPARQRGEPDCSPQRRRKPDATSANNPQTKVCNYEGTQ